MAATPRDQEPQRADRRRHRRCLRLDHRRRRGRLAGRRAAGQGLRALAFQRRAQQHGHQRHRRPHADQADKLTEALRDTVDTNGFPEVFGDLVPTHVREVPEPDPRLASSLVVARSESSVVKVLGTAPSCSRRIEGSGFVYAPEHVMTNAHVVAGTKTVRVEIKKTSHTRKGRRVRRPPRPRRAARARLERTRSCPSPTQPAPSGADAIVLGFPLDGPYDAQSARVRDVGDITGPDIYECGQRDPRGLHHQSPGAQRKLGRPAGQRRRPGPRRHLRRGRRQPTSATPSPLTRPTRSPTPAAPPARPPDRAPNGACAWSHRIGRRRAPSGRMAGIVPPITPGSPSELSRRPASAASPPSRDSAVARCRLSGLAMALLAPRLFGLVALSRCPPSWPSARHRAHRPVAGRSARCRKAWEYSTGAGVIVAVIDSGVTADHPDLAGQVLPGIDLVRAGGDGTADEVGHGTTVAGLIAGRSDDGEGVVGLAPDAKILPIRVLDAENQYRDAKVVAEGIVWAVDHGAASSTSPSAVAWRTPLSPKPSTTPSPATSSWSPAWATSLPNGPTSRLAPGPRTRRARRERADPRRRCLVRLPDRRARPSSPRPAPI